MAYCGTDEVEAAKLKPPKARAMLMKTGKGSFTGIFIKPNAV